MSTIATKRANFDLTPEQDEILANLRTALSASSIKDTVLRAAQVTTLLVNEVRQGNHLFVGRSAQQATRLAIPELETNLPPTWQWLVERPHPGAASCGSRGASCWPAPSGSTPRQAV